VVALQPSGKRAQGGQVGALDVVDPGVEPVAVQPGQQLGEGGDMAGEGIQVRAPGQRLLRLTCSSTSGYRDGAAVTR
jgi:hypothetical protein